ncbi:retrovirus-related pol polyprotein from transposon TNT 1-94 [Tanacetum coccineum]
MAAVNDVPQLVDKKGVVNILSSKLESRKSEIVEKSYDLLLSGNGTLLFKMFRGFPRNSDDEVDERSSEEYLRDLDIEFHERALLANSKRQGTMALADDELTVGKNHARNSEWIDITMRKRHIKEPIWYLDSGCSRSMTGVKSYLHKYVEQPVPKKFSHNFSSPYTPEQNGVAERKNRTVIEASRTMLNGSILSKHFWTEAVKIACYTQNRSIIVKRHDKTPFEIFRERIPDINYFHVFGYWNLLCFKRIQRSLNTRRQQIEETYHVIFDESIEAIRFTNTLVDEIGIDDSSRYPPNEFLYKDDPYRQYQVDFDVSYYVIPHGRSLTELNQENYVSEVIAPNELDIPLYKLDEGPT